MTASQRAALIGMLDAIRACSCCRPDVRARADALEHKIAPFRFLFRRASC